MTGLKTPTKATHFDLLLDCCCSSTPSFPLLLYSEGRPGLSDVSLRSGISGLCLIPPHYLPSFSSANTHCSFCLFFSACWLILTFFQKILQYVFAKTVRDTRFGSALVLQQGNHILLVVCAAYCHMTLVFAVINLYNILEFFIASVRSFFIL